MLGVTTRKKSRFACSSRLILGDIEVELDPAKAPKTAANFLRYVDGKFYDGGRFHRTVTPDNQPKNKVKIEVIQAGTNPDKAKDDFEPIKLERTKDTKLAHKDGTISMARDEPGHGDIRLLHLHRRPAGARLRRQAQSRRPGLRRFRQGRQGHGRGPQDPEVAGGRADSQAGRDDPIDRAPAGKVALRRIGFGLRF